MPSAFRNLVADVAGRRGGGSGPFVPESRPRARKPRPFVPPPGDVPGPGALPPGRPSGDSGPFVPGAPPPVFRAPADIAAGEPTPGGGLGPVLRAPAEGVPTPLPPAPRELSGDVIAPASPGPRGLGPYEGARRSLLDAMRRGAQGAFGGVERRAPSRYDWSTGRWI